MVFYLCLSPLRDKGLQRPAAPDTYQKKCFFVPAAQLDTNSWRVLLTFLKYLQKAVRFLPLPNVHLNVKSEIGLFLQRRHRSGSAVLPLRKSQSQLGKYVNSCEQLISCLNRTRHFQTTSCSVVDCLPATGHFVSFGSNSSN